MNSLDDIFENSIAEELNIDVFDAEEWAASKKAERDQAYSLISAMAKSVATYGDKLKKYLDVQSRFDKYSVNNALLITAQMPDATELADFKTWRESLIHVKKDADPIMILEPGREYTKDDGSIGTSYNIKKVFDISQTDSESDPRSVENKDMKTLLKGLIYNAPCRIVVTSPENVPEGKQAVYFSTEKAIFIREDATARYLFEDLANEIALAHLDKAKVDIPDKDFIACCTSYMLCSKFNVNTERFNFDPLPENFNQADDKDIKKQLGFMRDTTNSILSDMNRGLEKQKGAAEKGAR